MHPLGGRVALVTGAGRRVGRAIALALGASGMRVVVHYNGSAAGAQETARQIGARGGMATAMRADLSDVVAAERLIDAVVEDQGELAVLVNSAAVMLRTPVGETSAKDWDAMFALNVRAPYFLAQHAAPALRAARGCIVNIADLAAFETWPAYVPHGITKAAVVQMTRGLAHALAPTIRVNAVAPGVVLLPDGWKEADGEHLRATTPLGRLGSPDDVAGAVLYLIGAEFVTGEVITVDGGRHVRT
jgi:pteridine reductase